MNSPTVISLAPFRDPASAGSTTLNERQGSMTPPWLLQVEADSQEDRAFLDQSMHGLPEAHIGTFEIVEAAEACLYRVLNGALAAREPFVLPDWLVEIFGNLRGLGGLKASPELAEWALARAKARGVWRPPPVPRSGTQRTTQVYVFYRHRDKAVKIGISTNPNTRLSALRTASGDDLILVARYPGTIADERDAHVRFAECRIDREWFHLTDELREWIRDLGGNI